MPVQLRNGGSWYTVPNGNLRVKDAGAWRSANRVYVKLGAVGGGSWYDSGYTGYPPLPSAPWVEAWDYNNVQFRWAAGSGGAPTVSYHIHCPQTGLNTTTTATSWTMAVNWDTEYRFYVSAIATGGLETGWSTPSGYGIGIGHPQQDTYGNVVRAKAWQSAVQWAYRCMDELFGVYVPDYINVKSVTWANLRTSNGDVVSPGAGRTVNLYLNGGWGGVISDYVDGGVIYSSGGYSSWGLGLNYFGSNSFSGIAPRGYGWSQGSSATIDPNGKMLLYADAVYFNGDEYYNSWELTSSIAARGNYYL